MSGFSPIQRLLGLPDGADNPFDLLGLTPGAFAGAPGSVNDEHIVRDALARRLDRLKNHPHSVGHEADEVRLALYAAAAQLTDPRVRSALAAQWRSRTATAGAGEPHRDESIVAYREAALPVFLSAGGLNAQSRRQLVALAHAHGLNTSDVRRALQPGHMAMGAEFVSGAGPALKSVASNGHMLPAERRPSVYDGIERAAVHDAARARRRVREAIAASAMIALVIACALVATFFIRAPITSDADRRAAAKPEARDAATPPPADGADASPDRSERISTRRNGAEPSPSDQSEPVPDERRLEPSELLAELRRLPDMLASRPGDSAWRFERVALHFARQWTTLDEATLSGAVEAVVAYIHRAPAGAESSRRALGVIDAGARRIAGADSPLLAGEVLSGAWSTGVLTRLTRERDLTGAVKYAIDRELVYALGDSVPPDSDATFIAGARAGLRAMFSQIPALAHDDIDEDAILEAWETWLHALDATHASMSDEAPRERVILSAVEWLLANGPSAAREPVTRDIIERLLASVRWRSELSEEAAAIRAPLPAHAELVAWFSDRRIRIDNLAVVTEWVVRDSGAPGVGVGYVLPRSAGADARASMRDRFASVWRLDREPPESGVATRWMREAQRVSAVPLGRGPLLTSFVRAAVLARLNEAAARRWAGEVDEAWTILHNLRDPVEQAASSPSGRGDSVVDQRSYNDGEWALRYLSSEQSHAGRLEALTALDRRGSGRIGPIDADVLAEAALLAGNDQVRTIAGRIIRRYSNQATMINGVLEALPRAPRRQHVTAVVESLTSRRLPPMRDPEWPAAARRALVEQQLELMAGEGEHGAIDRLARLIADAYAGSLHALGAPDATEDPALLADRLWEVWRAEADRYGAAHRSLYSLSTLERRRAGRSRLATGPVDAFAAAQAGLAEMMGYVIGAERPTRVGEVERVLDRLVRERHDARHIGAQIEAAEHAILSLWMIRYGVDAGESSR
ncbi:MAG: hypothetical protein EA376_12060 [Phycisphaeraceae bacterium]|nr:MAG: hypothetical protein EA376_12060 [Phycisphaeraceae bacterium]